MNWSVAASVVSSGLIAVFMLLMSNARRDLQDKLKTMGQKQDEIYTEVCKINSRVGKLEKFEDLHTESVDRRFEAVNEDIQELKGGPIHPAPRRRG